MLLSADSMCLFARKTPCTDAFRWKRIICELTKLKFSLIVYITLTNANILANVVSETSIFQIVKFLFDQSCLVSVCY